MINPNLYDENDFEKAATQETFFKLTREAAYNLYIGLFNKYQETKKQNEVLRQMLKKDDDDKTKYQNFYEERPESSSSSNNNNLGFRFGYQRSSLVKDVHVLLSGLAKKSKEKVLDKKPELKEHFKGFLPKGNKNDDDNDNDNKQRQEIQNIVKDSFYEQNKAVVEHRVLEEKEIKYDIDGERHNYDLDELKPSNEEVKELKLMTKKMMRENINEDEIIKKVSQKANEQTEMKMPLVSDLDVTNKTILNRHKVKAVEDKLNEITKVISQNKNIFKLLYDFCIKEQKQRETSSKYDTQTTDMKIKTKTLTDFLKKQKCDVKAAKEMMAKSSSIKLSKTFTMIDLALLKQDAESFNVPGDASDDDSAGAP